MATIFVCVVLGFIYALILLDRELDKTQSLVNQLEALELQELGVSIPQHLLTPVNAPTPTKSFNASIKEAIWAEPEEEISLPVAAPSIIAEEIFVAAPTEEIIVPVDAPSVVKITGLSNLKKSQLVQVVTQLGIETKESATAMTVKVLKELISQNPSDHTNEVIKEVKRIKVS